MINPIQLYQVAKLHQKDVEAELASRQIANQVKAPKIARPGTLKRFVMMSFSSTQDVRAAKTGEAYTG